MRGWLKSLGGSWRVSGEASPGGGGAGGGGGGAE